MAPDEENKIEQIGHELEQKTEELGASMEKLTGEMDEANSKKHAFVRGLFMGVGTAIGASIIAALLIAILSGVLNSFDEIGFIRSLTDWLEAKGIIKQ